MKFLMMAMLFPMVFSESCRADDLDNINFSANDVHSEAFQKNVRDAEKAYLKIQKGLEAYQEDGKKLEAALAKATDVGKRSELNALIVENQKNVAGAQADLKKLFPENAAKLRVKMNEALEEIQQAANNPRADNLRTVMAQEQYEKAARKFTANWKPGPEMTRIKGKWGLALGLAALAPIAVEAVFGGNEARADSLEPKDGKSALGVRDQTEPGAVEVGGDLGE